jgi:hypothetical protein
MVPSPEPRRKLRRVGGKASSACPRLGHFVCRRRPKLDNSRRFETWFFAFELQFRLAF